MEQYPGVSEAIRRLPEETIHERNYRMARALDLSMKHRVLPEGQWTNTDEVRTVWSGSKWPSLMEQFLSPLVWRRPVIEKMIRY